MKQDGQNKDIKTTISVGPIFFYWDQEKAKNFYKSIANEESINEVYVGEVICSKRDTFEFNFWREIISNLKSSGKNVIFSTLALISNDYETKTIKEIIDRNVDLTIEANDVSTIALLDGRRAEIGPLFNIYNEESIKFLKKKNVSKVTLPTETSFSSLKTFATDNEIELGLQVFGKMPLSISSRCYHARAYDLSKANCNFSCARDPNGLEVKTLENFSLFSVNGLQTLSHSYCSLLNEISELKEIGINNFRISPQDQINIPKICALFRNVADKKISTTEADLIIRQEVSNSPLSNGFLHNNAGMRWIKNDEL